MSSERPPGKKTGQPITASQIAGVWRLRSARRTAYGSTSDWFGAHPDGLLIFTDDLHFTEAVTRTDLPPVVSGDRLSATPQENRALAQGTLGCYGTYTTGQDGSLAGQHILGSTFPDWNNTERGADDVHVTVSDGRLSQVLRLGDDDTVTLTWEYAGTAGAPTTANQVAAAWRLDSARADTPGGTVQPFGPEPGGYLIFADSGVRDAAAFASLTGLLAPGGRIVMDDVTPELALPDGSALRQSDPKRELFAVVRSDVFAVAIEGESTAGKVVRRAGFG